MPTLEINLFAFIGGGGAGGAVLIRLMVAGLFSLALSTGLVCIANRKILLRSYLLTCCALFILVVSLINRNSQRRESAPLKRPFPSTTLTIQSDLGEFQTNYNELPNHRAILIQHHASFLLDWDGTQLRGKAQANIVDRMRTDDREFSFSISGFADRQGMESFLAGAFQCIELEPEASFASGEFAFRYKIHKHGTVDFNVTRNPQGI